MRLRTKIFIILFLSTMISAMISFFVFGYAAYNGTVKLEQKIATMKAERDGGLINREIDIVASLASSLIMENLPELLANPPKNLPSEQAAEYDLLQNKQINLLQIYDVAGNFLGGEIRDLETEKSIELPEFSQKFLPPTHPLLRHNSLVSELSGIYLTKGAVLVIASLPFADREKTGRIGGTLIVGRFLETSVKLVTKQFNTSYSLVPSDSTFHADFSLLTPERQKSMPDIERIRRDVERKKISIKTDLEKKQFFVYQKVPVLNSPDDLLLETRSANIIHGLIDKNWYFIMFLFLLIGLSTLALLTALSQFFLISPVQSLTKTMVEIRDTHSLPSIKTLNRNDEIGIMAREFAELLQRLQGQSNEMSLLGDLDNLLAASESTDEASAVITRMASTLFVGNSGALSLLNSSRNLYSTLSHWGGEWPGEQAFAPTDCWALRRGQAHLSDKNTPNPICPHLPGDLDSPVLCMPLMAQGETLGVIHIMAGQSGVIEEKPRRLLSSLAEHTSLALANLRLRDALRFQSVRDPLTGLFNRRYLEESLEREIGRAERRETQVAVMMLDLDHFKRFNDTFGHEAGDFVLKQLGLMMKNFVRKEDIACRYGGEEFTFILPDTDPEAALRRASEFCERMRTLDLRFQDQALGLVTVSIGVACYPKHGSVPEALLRTADSALYHAKKEGRDRAVLAG